MTIHLSQLSGCWIWHLTSSWAQFLPNELEFFISCNIKITKTYCSVFWYVLFYKNLLFSIILIIIFYFDICIKFRLSSIISTIKKWQRFTWYVFNDKNIMFERKTATEKSRKSMLHNNTFNKIYNTKRV